MAADAFEATSRARLGLVVADVVARGLGEVPALAEGPQLMPALARPLPAGCGVWLVPDPEPTRLARCQPFPTGPRSPLTSNRPSAPVRQGRLWMGQAGLAVAPAYPFGCECGRSRCRAIWPAPPISIAHCSS